MDHVDLPSGGGPGIVYVGCDQWPRVLAACRLIREMGCRWPIQAWYRCGDPVDAIVAAKYDIDLIEIEVTAQVLGVPVPADRADDVTFASTYTQLDQIVLLGADVYPCRMPCKLIAAIRAARNGHWEDEMSEVLPTPALIDRAARMLVRSVIPRYTAGRALGKSTAKIYSLGIKPTFVRYGDTLPVDDLPMGRRLRELLIAAGFQLTGTSTSRAAASETPSPSPH